MMYRVWRVSIATTQSENTLLFSLAIDWKRFWFVESLHTSSERNVALDYKTGFVVSLVASFSMLQLHCSILLVGCFMRILAHFHWFCGVSPHPGLVMHFVIIRHTLLCLEVFVLYPSYLTSVDALCTVGGNFSLSKAFFFLRMAHMDCSLSLIRTSTHTR